MKAAREFWENACSRSEGRQQTKGIWISDIPDCKEVIKDCWACVKFLRSHLNITVAKDSHLSTREAKNHNELKYIRYVKTHESIKILRKKLTDHLWRIIGKQYITILNAINKWKESNTYPFFSIWILLLCNQIVEKEIISLQNYSS